MSHLPRATAAEPWAAATVASATTPDMRHENPPVGAQLLGDLSTEPTTGMTNLVSVARELGWK